MDKVKKDIFEKRIDKAIEAVIDAQLAVDEMSLLFAKGVEYQTIFDEIFEVNLCTLCRMYDYLDRLKEKFLNDTI